MTNLQVLSLKWIMPLIGILAFMPQSSGGCPFKARFSYTQLDTAYQFNLSGGRVDAPVTWDFGDGYTATGKPYPQAVYHQYAKNGKYTVTMFYWDSIYDCRDTIKEEVCYYRLDSLPVFKRSGDTLIASAMCLPQGAYRWSFGDYTYAWGCQVRHVYTKPGFYYPQLMFVKDSITGCVYYPPSNKVAMDFTRCGFTAEFTPKLYKGKVVAWSGPFYTEKKVAGYETWKWGDGSKTDTSIIQANSFEHKYLVSGIYTICHILSDSANCKDSVCQTVQIDSCNAIAKFSYIANGKTLQFKNESNGWKYEWRINDQLIGLDFNSSYTFPTNGNYNVCLKTFGTDNCDKEVCSVIAVFSCNQLAYNNIVPRPDSVDCSIVQFDNSNIFSSYKWDFGDGSISYEKSPTHAFKEARTYAVNLLGIDSSFQLCTDSIVFEYNNPCPVCDIRDSMVLTYDVNDSQKAKLENYTFNRKTNKPVKLHFWDFGDGTTSTEASPKHVYTISGRVLVTYVAIDSASNCTDTSRFYVNIPANGKPFTLNVNYNNYVSIVTASRIRQFTLYPNPFNREIILKGNDLNVISSIKLYDALGQEILLTYSLENERCYIRIQEQLPSGMYLMYIQTQSGIEVLKLMRE